MVYWASRLYTRMKKIMYFDAITSNNTKMRPKVMFRGRENFVGLRLSNLKNETLS